MVTSKLAPYLPVPKFPDIEPSNPTEGWSLKKYPSYYIPLNERLNLLDQWVQEIGADKFVLGYRVTGWVKYAYGYLVQLQGPKTRYIQCQQIIIGGGRFWPLLKQLNNTHFRRIEFGVRVVYQNNHLCPDLLDPKFIWNSSNMQIRTFCHCHHGETVLTNCLGIRTYSGRADIRKTNSNNFGLNIRLKYDNPELLHELLNTQPFENITPDELDQYVGSHALGYLVQALELVLEKWGFLEDIRLCGPTLEGVANYPVLDGHLKVPGENMWIGGDATGRFRGIVASMLSGFYIGLQQTKLKL